MAKGKGGGGGGGKAGGEGNGDEKKENENGGGTFLNVVLKVHLHCDGCIQRIKKHTLKFPGVLKVEFEGESKVKIMAQKNVDPAKLRDKLQEKTLKMTELIYPQPSKKEDKKNETKNDKPKEAAVTTVQLKVAYHCHGCGERLNKAVASYKGVKGVHEVNIDKEKERVKVTGRMDVKKMVEHLQKKLNKPVEVVNDNKKDNEKQKAAAGKDKQQQPNENNDNEKESNAGKKESKLEYLVNGSGYIGICDGSGRVLQIFDPPQLLSDDNPNACSIM